MSISKRGQFDSLYNILWQKTAAKDADKASSGWSNVPFFVTKDIPSITAFSSNKQGVSISIAKVSELVQDLLVPEEL